MSISLKNKIITLLGIFIAITTNAQSIRGVVQNEKGSPIDGTTISILNTSLQTISNQKGYFSFNALKNGNFIKANSIGTLRSVPYYIQFSSAKYYHKTCENIRRKVEQQNETLYQKALTKIFADIFCPKIHYDENSEPLIDETGDYLNYKDVFLQYMKG